MFKMNFNPTPQPRNTPYQTYPGSTFSFASSGGRPLPNLLMNISNNGKSCGGCGKK